MLNGAKFLIKYKLMLNFKYNIKWCLDLNLVNVKIKYVLNYVENKF